MARTLGTTYDGQGPRQDDLDATAGGDADARASAGRPSVAPGTSIGRYVVLGEIGSGAMGVVLATFDPELNRKVALKLLFGGAGSTRRPSAARLMREAQAIARLSHPNVVNVYDVGQHEGAVFLAMEFLDGDTLTDWLASRPRSLPEILAVFAEAGCGLGAAHAAGLVHRDFKPDNVLVSPDGRVRVVDFGLARADPARYSGSFESDLLDAPEPGVPAPRVWSDSDVLNTSLTRDDAVVGTPRFMGPEQHAGEGPDARSDQYSFCVALYQALYGQDPFEGPTLRDLVERKQQGRVAPIPQGTPVPLWLEEAVRRGLCADPDQRWPSMEALVAVLRRDPTSTRRRWGAMLLGGLAVGGVMAVAGYQRGTAERPCQGSAAHVEAVWNDGRRASVGEAIVATGLSFSAHTRTEVIRTLDDYAAAWTDAHHEACVATQVRGEQSAELLDLRMACLDRAKSALGAFIDVMSVADADVVPKAVQAAGSLPKLSECADVDRLQARVAPPSDDAERHLVATLEGKLEQARVLQSAGKATDALALANEALRGTETIDYAPLRAAALDRVGVLLEATGDYPGAEARLRDAVFTALRAGDDERAASAATALVSVTGDRLARYDAGLLWGEQAAALLDRVGVEGLARARLANNIGNVSYRKGDLADARRHYVEALAIREELNGSRDAMLGLELINLGNVQLAEHDYEAALATFRRSQDIIESSLGREHPNVMFAVVSIGVVYQEQHRFDEARAQFQQAMPAMARAFGNEHPFVATAALNLGNALRELGRYDESLERLAVADEIYRASVGAEHPNVAAVAHSRGLIHLARHQASSARVQLSEALRIRRANYGDAHVDVAEALLSLAELDRQQGDAAAGVAGIREAISILDAASAPLDARAIAHAALADALWDAGQPETMALHEADLAMELLRGAGPQGDRPREDLRAWRAAHPPGSRPVPGSSPSAERTTPPARP